MPPRALVLACAALVLGCAEQQAAQRPAPPPAEAASVSAPAPATSAAATAASGASNPPAGNAPSHIETRTFASAALGVQKRYLVYLPRGYDDSQHRFPVVYLLHGLGGNETDWTQQGHLREAADAASFAAIVVMPDGDDGFYANGTTPVEYETCLHQKPPWDPRETPSTYCVRAPRYEDYVVVDVVADVDASFRTLRDRRSRGIAGLSMGGFGALSLAMRHTDVFSAAASHSGMASLLYQGPHPYVQGRATLADSMAHWGSQYTKRFREHVQRVFGSDLEVWRSHDPSVVAARLERGALALHLDCGDADDYHFEDHASYLHDLLTSRGIPHEFKIVPGAHRWEVWAAMLPSSLRFFAAQLAAEPRASASGP
jgi:S-formylglutathione hydrolase FrmB